MNETWTALTLRIEYLDGAAVIAYLTLPHPVRLKTHYVRQVGPELLVDFSRGGRPLGIEILDPRRASVTALNRVGASASLTAWTDRCPLHAA
jgi:hypothetical protein